MYKAEFDYSARAHRQSMKMMVTEDPTATNPAYNLSYTRYYLGDYEKEVRGNTTTEVCYINTPIGLTAAYVTQNNTSETYYLHTDHLGSIIGVSNNNQQKIYEISYDAWGQKRQADYWFPPHTLPTPPSWLWRGYTGHEHLEEFDLINMNARLYDPILGRMLSPDNYLQDPYFSQNYNRYSYCWNNPLKYTDPTGNFTFSDGAAIVLIVAGVAICVTSSGTLAAIGGAMVVGGVSHFGYTLQDYSNGMSWDDASNKNGVTVGVKFDVNMSGGPKKSTPPPPINHHSSPAAPTSNLIAGEKSEEYYSLTASMDGGGVGGSEKLYSNQYGDPSTSLVNFKNHYQGKPLNQIVTGESSFLGYKYPNYIDPEYRFVNLSNGRQVDMTHFLVVGPRGNILGFGNEFKQIGSHPESAFYPQDLYSNRLGVNFFDSYEPLIQENPNNISNYIYWFLSNPNNINIEPIRWETGPKY